MAPSVEIPEQPRQVVVLRGITSPLTVVYLTLLSAYRQVITSRAAAGTWDTGFGMGVCVLGPVAHKHERNPRLSPSCWCQRGTGGTSSTSASAHRGQGSCACLAIIFLGCRGSMNASLCAGLRWGPCTPSGMRKAGWKTSGWDLAGRRAVEMAGAAQRPHAH